jgi:hypothetical protein
VSRRTRSTSIQKSNPVRNLVTQKQRAAEIARERQRAEQIRAEQLKHELPAIIEERVGAQVQKLEDRIITDFREMGKKAIEESTAALTEQLNGRIETLEKVSKIQSRTIASLRDTSQMAEQKVSAAVSQIERSLATTVPGGFELEPLPERASVTPSGGVHPQFQIPARTEIVKADPVEVSELPHGFCPKCTSTDVRRANRRGLCENLLRLFFIAPFRCRACRHKFYRF